MISRFGDLEFSWNARRLTRGARLVRLTGQPLQLLIVLLDDPGRLVTREEIRRRLWPETSVDFEHSLDVALNRLRAALGDSAKQPVFIETVPRLGYRFIARVQTDHSIPGLTRKWPLTARVGLYALTAIVAVLLGTIAVIHQHYGAILRALPARHSGATLMEPR